MTTIPDWMIRSGEGLTASEYAALPGDVRHQIEIIDGGIMVHGRREHVEQRITQRIAAALDAVRPHGFEVGAETDLRLEDRPLLVRRPDVVVHRASGPADDVVRPRSCLLVVEVVSRRSVTTDQVHKPAEYAASGIRHFWRVEYHAAAIGVFRYELDPMTRTYALVGLDKDKLSVKTPIALELDLEALR